MLSGAGKFCVGGHRENLCGLGFRGSGLGRPQRFVEVLVVLTLEEDNPSKGPGFVMQVPVPGLVVCGRAL